MSNVCSESFITGINIMNKDLGAFPLTWQIFLNAHVFLFIKKKTALQDIFAYQRPGRYLSRHGRSPQAVGGTGKNVRQSIAHVRSWLI